MPTNKYIDLSESVKLYSETVHQAATMLIDEMEQNIVPFPYDKGRTEWYVPAAQEVLALITSGGNGLPLKKVASMAGGKLSATKLSSLRASKEERDLVPIVEAKAFIKVSRQIIDSAFGKDEQVERQPLNKPNRKER